MKITTTAQQIQQTIGSGVTYNNSGGSLPAGTDNLQDAIDAILGGLIGSYLTTTLGGQGVVQDLGPVTGTAIIDLANANYFVAELTADTTLSAIGWITGKDSQITLEVSEDGTGGWTPTFSGVTWIGGTTPIHDTTASSVSFYVFLSRDGGTTIYGAAVGEGSGGVGSFLTVVDGGGGTVQAHGNLGSTETIDTANGNYHWGTLNASCTFTFSTIADTAERWFTLELLEDGTGGWTPTWPGSVSWVTGSAPTHTTTAGTTTIYTFFTRNGGTTWIGGQLGGAGSPVSASATTTFLTSNVTQTTAGTWYSGPNTGSLTGTFLISGQLYVDCSSLGGANEESVRIYDGAAAIATAALVFDNTTNRRASIVISPIVVTAAGTTYTIQATNTSNGATIKDVLDNNGTNDKASWITAVKIA